MLIWTIYRPYKWAPVSIQVLKKKKCQIQVLVSKFLNYKSPIPVYYLFRFQAQLVGRYQREYLTNYFNLMSYFHCIIHINYIYKHFKRLIINTNIAFVTVNWNPLNKNLKFSFNCIQHYNHADKFIYTYYVQELILRNVSICKSFE